MPKGYLKAWTPPASVGGGRKESGFCASSSGLPGPGALELRSSLVGYGLRSSVKPGLTGLAQVWGSYATEVEDKLRLDLLYIANQSLMLDLELILHTVRVVFHRSQSAGIDRPAVRRLHLPIVNEPLRDALAENLPFREAVRGPAQTKLQ